MAGQILGDIPLVTVAVVDISDTARRLYGDRADYIAGRPLPERDYRLTAKTPTGGEVSFHQGATADDVAAYWRREGWLGNVDPERPVVEITAEMIERFAGAWLTSLSAEAGLRAALEAAGFTVAGGDAR